MKTADLEIKIADWQKDSKTLKAIRKSVFIEEQNVPENLEWDGLDPSCVHFLVKMNNIPVATARLKPDGQIGRMAIFPPYRRQGIGGRLLEFILMYAAKSNLNKVYLHAQVEVINFYAKHGFETEGEEFMDADIPHRAMFKILA